LKPEWWSSPLAQEEKYQGRKKTCDKREQNNNNNSKNKYKDRELQYSINIACYIHRSTDHSLV
jgi:hypothetical protein